MLYCKSDYSPMDRTGFCTVKNKQVTDCECANCPVHKMDEYWHYENKILKDKNAVLNQKYCNLLEEFRKSLERTKELQTIEKKYNELLTSFWMDMIKTVTKILSDTGK